MQWPQFWDRFESNIVRRPIADVDKLSYLFCCLEGEALKSIKGLSTTNSNYKIAIETLQNRYGKQEYIINAHYKALRCIPPALDKASDCRNLLDEIERHLLILES